MTYEQIFDECQRIFNIDNQQDRANELFKLLDKIGNKKKYIPVLNHLIREIGIYPYINIDTAIFNDKLVCECFKTNVGEREPKVLHREQLKILTILLSGENLILSAPTSFGKSFIIDALIATKKPLNVLIIVPTISLMDEARRRLTRKFGDKYHIVTTSKSQLQEKNIIIFPQERALEYFENLHKEFKFDFFIVDEFYKVSSKYDKDRASILQHAILKYSKISKQRYYLCPNIDKFEQDDNLCKGMRFMQMTNNTVFIDIIESYEEKKFSKDIKLVEILSQNNKTLIYTKSQNEIRNVCDIIIRSSFNISKFPKFLEYFCLWISKHYGEFYLIDALKKAVGIHHGKLHRCLSQIQVKLFEEPNGLQTIISTSSLIEGINIPAKSLILWNNKKATSNLDSFTYKNILGRSGRMFQYFVGKVFLLEKPPRENEEVLEIEINIDSMIGDEDIQQELPSDKQEEIQNFKTQLIKIIGIESYEKLRKFSKFKNNKNIIIEIAKLLVDSNLDSNAFSYLLDNKPDQWFLLKTMANISQFHIRSGLSQPNMVDLIKQMSLNWQKDIPTLLQEMNVSLESFFEIESHISFKISSLFADMNILAQVLYSSVDISPFVTKLSNAFLPSVVFTLEEFGFPRMLSKKLHKYKFINFENNELCIDDVLAYFIKQGIESIINILKENDDFDEFDEYVLKYFYDGLN